MASTPFVADLLHEHAGMDMGRAMATAVAIEVVSTIGIIYAVSRPGIGPGLVRGRSYIAPMFLIACVALVAASRAQR